MLKSLRRRLGEASDSGSMPARVREAIRAQQDHSEILIGWVQFAVVTTFGILYALAPKTFSPDAGFEPVPWALGAYTLFTLLRLVLAYRGGLPGWFLALSVVIDITLLMGLIWSFHLQYEQPASFYLKAPTILYVFIFIALRALRFEARFVLLAGVVAAFGWLLMMVYAMTVDPIDDMVTRDYVKYMTSNSILLGAEFDKMISILVVTSIIAVTLVRARRLLVRAVAEGTAARDLSRFFAPEVARQITESENRIEAGQGETREAAILNVDIRGFTVLAGTVTPSEVMELLAQYQARLVPIIQAHGGSIDKFMGDGIMATFGAAVPSDTYAADALRAIDAVIAEVDRWNIERRGTGEVPMKVNAAVACGRVVFGAVGDETRLEYTVIGDSVNLSAKLEKHNKDEQVRALTTAKSFAAARAQGYQPTDPCEERPGRQVQGIGEPLDLVILAA
jgi:adenylate cyclase